MSKQKEVVWNAMWKILPENPVILEIGACIGDGVKLFLKKRPGARITAVEASIDNFGALINNVPEDVRCVHAAVGFNGFTTIAQHDEPVSHTCYRRAAKHKSGSIREYTVPGCRLGSLIDGPVDLLRIDCYGGEYKIFPDDQDAMKKVRLLVLTMHVKPPPFTTGKFVKKRENIMLALTKRMKFVVGGKPSKGCSKHIHQLWRNRNAVV